MKFQVQTQNRCLIFSTLFDIYTFNCCEGIQAVTSGPTALQQQYPKLWSPLQ